MAMERREKVKNLIDQLCAGLYERDEVVKLALLSAIAGESIFLLGPPGVGKSLIARRLKYAFKDAHSFEYLMTRFSTPEEVFGPVSIQKLKEEDKYERKTDRYMPGANIVFLDEIWKASSSIQNALLTIINEKVYRNGEQEIAVDLKSLITASNELPPEGENFGPLYDRLLVRYQLSGVKEGKRFLKMITGTDDLYHDEVDEQYKISTSELEAWHRQIDAVAVEDEVLSVIQIIRDKIEDYNQQQEDPYRHIQVFDRRWKKVIRLLRTAAFLNERPKVDLMDCFLMIHCLWNQPHQIEAVQEIVSETIRKHGYSVSIGLNMLKREVEDFRQEVEAEVRIKHTVTEEILRPVEDEYYELRKNGEQFAGRYLMVKDYNRLKVNDLEVVNLYDEDYKLVNRLGAEKADEQFTVVLKHNSQRHRLALKTYQKERPQYIFKAPHPLVKKFWDERYEKIEGYLKEQTKRVRDNTPEELLKGRTNMFIDEKLVPIVEANHREVLSSLEELQLKLEKTRHTYENA
jgi:MoxR-like ATPase